MGEVYQNMDRLLKNCLIKKDKVIGNFIITDF